MNNGTLRIFKIAAAFFLGCFFVCSCENDIREVQNLNQKTLGIEEAKGIESYLSQDGKVKAKLTAPLMLRYQLDTPKVEFPNSLRVDFFDDSTKVESKLFSKYGRYLENENKVFLRDSVVVFNMSGDTLFCKELYWDQNKAIFYTDKNVIIHKPDQKVFGNGLIADQSFKWFTIKHPHDSYLNIPDSSFLGD
ncbi:LPS export ABC transporter periplasmic protein LptC [Segetibacter koreensis]|uniref:LPS export ABC transporter periplasmic protein LptC n=1 Tax=Segetibacter koreensis TaxID=398037 RepID=UPI000373F4FC|nr:LPS export ABC transporter periplasmic protein LptC [Segetibacter koreensis]